MKEDTNSCSIRKGQKQQWNVLPVMSYNAFQKSASANAAFIAACSSKSGNTRISPTYTPPNSPLASGNIIMPVRTPLFLNLLRFFQKSLVVSHNEVTVDFVHQVNNDTHDDQQACPSEKSCQQIIFSADQRCRNHAWQNRNHCEE